MFYQFDYEIFRKGQYEEGYFDYHNTAFGNSYKTKEEVFDCIEKIISSDFAISSDYLNAHKNFFPLYDTENCKRVYEIVRDL